MNEQNELTPPEAGPPAMYLQGSILIYYLHDGVAEQTNYWVDGCTHLVLTVVNGTPRRADIVTDKADWIIR